MLVSRPIRVDSAAQTEAMQEHPLINGIIGEFLLFQTGVTYAELETAREEEIRHLSDFGVGGICWFLHAFQIPLYMGRNWRSHKISPFKRRTVGFDIFWPLNRIRYYVPTTSYQYMRFQTDCIYIGVRILCADIARPMTASGCLNLTLESKNVIQYWNQLLPYGLHFLQMQGELVLRAPNNPRTNPERKFRIIQTFPIVRKSKFDGTVYLSYEVKYSISLTEIYVPSWRPYYVSQDGDGDAESRDSGGDA
jgi:hypothetical protein